MDRHHNIKEPTVELATQQVTLKAGRIDYAISAAKVSTNAVTLGQFSANVNVSPKLSWRMIYDATQIYACSQSSGFTSTVFSLFCADTQQECIDKAKALGLTIPPDPEPTK
jgi:hypothetical protein